MGKAKHKDNFSFVVDLKAVLALKPEHRSKWLSKACRKVADGEANVKHVYDVLSSRKIVADMSDKVGRRMLRILREHLYLFSEKQQRYLGEDSPLATNFSVGDRSEEEPEEAEGAGAGTAAGPSARPTGVDEAAARMEEMMARCRDFVRAKASTFEERQREAEQAELQARLAAERERKRQAEERLRQEWEEIHRWHQQLLAWEQASMAALDERAGRLQQLLEEEQRAAARLKVSAPPEVQKDRARARSRRGRSSSSGSRSAGRRKGRGRRRRGSSSSSGARGEERQRRSEKRHRNDEEATRKAQEVQRFLARATGKPPPVTLADMLRS